MTKRVLHHQPLPVEPFEADTQWRDEAASRQLDARARAAIDRAVAPHVVIELAYRRSGKGGGRSEHNVTKDVREFLGRLAGAVGHLRATVGHSLDQSRASSRVVRVALEFDCPPGDDDLVAGETALQLIASNIWQSIHALTTAASVVASTRVEARRARVAAHGAVAEPMTICPAMLPARLRNNPHRRQHGCTPHRCRVYDLRRVTRPSAP